MADNASFKHIMNVLRSFTTKDFVLEDVEFVRGSIMS